LACNKKLECAIEMKKNMKRKMKRILNEIDENRFHILYNEYVFEKIRRCK
jgi:hypothetical protein